MTTEVAWYATDPTQAGDSTANSKQHNGRVFFYLRCEWTLSSDGINSFELYPSTEKMIASLAKKLAIRWLAIVSFMSKRCLLSQTKILICARVLEKVLGVTMVGTQEEVAHW